MIGARVRRGAFEWLAVGGKGVVCPDCAGF